MLSDPLLGILLRLEDPLRSEWHFARRQVGENLGVVLVYGPHFFVTGSTPFLRLASFGIIGGFH
jgi:hypothetical protein